MVIPYDVCDMVVATESNRITMRFQKIDIEVIEFLLETYREHSLPDFSNL
jgi:hypothetical protein